MHFISKQGPPIALCSHVAPWFLIDSQSEHLKVLQTWPHQRACPEPQSPSPTAGIVFPWVLSCWPNRIDVRKTLDTCTLGPQPPARDRASSVLTVTQRQDSICFLNLTGEGWRAASFLRLMRRPPGDLSPRSGPLYHSQGKWPVIRCRRYSERIAAFLSER